MEKTAFIFGSDAGTTEEIGEKLQTLLGNELELIDVANTSVDKINTYTNIIFASSTWGSGDLQSDWEDFENNLSEIKFDNKVVALLGLGDQEGYADTFCDAIGLIHEHIKDKAHIIGQTSTDGYNYEASQAEVDGQFVGLVIDEDNQDDLTDERLEAWAKVLKEGFK
jgi:flavodoxin I